MLFVVKETNQKMKEGEITAIYAALSSSLGQSVRLRCEEIEASIDRVR